MTPDTEQLIERLNTFTTCGCCDDDWPPLRRDLSARIAELEEALTLARKMLDGNHVFSGSREEFLAIIDARLATGANHD